MGGVAGGELPLGGVVARHSGDVIFGGDPQDAVKEWGNIGKEGDGMADGGEAGGEEARMVEGEVG